MRNNGRPGLVSCAISAVDTALWDLKGKLLGLPVCRLLGMAHDSVPIYGSGGFTSYDDNATRAQLERWVHEWRIPRVKIKIALWDLKGKLLGLPVCRRSMAHDSADLRQRRFHQLRRQRHPRPAGTLGARVADPARQDQDRRVLGSHERRDLDRIALARTVIGPDTELYVDANGGYRRKQAIRMAHAMAGHDVTWFEEPVSSDDLAGLREVRDQVSADVTAGEYGYDLAYFHRMLAADAVDCLQIDVTRCGGITDWLRAAAVAAAHNVDVSGHCAPNLHAHVATAVANLRHLEYFHDHHRIEQMFFDGALSPQGGVLRPDQHRPGFGLEFKHRDADRYRVR
ncbi:mandelate racemase / muconate lactonizing enzyme, C-terminal domain protein [Mycobacterium avium MAV_120709_2344]|nr:mandelate racemase / muconate lactonizing enzyme, C-terminal domain protein [Mycobacterium avium MAV_120709_2344]